MISYPYTLLLKKCNQAVMLIICLGIFLSCKEKSGFNNKERSDGRNLITTAKRLSISKNAGITKITIINPWQGAEKVNMTYYLVRRGSAIPSGLDSASVIFIPVRKIVCMSTTHVAMISALGEDKTIVGISGTEFIYSKVLTDMAEQGLIKDVGYESNLNKELILQIRPDITMIYGIGSESSGYVGKIQELGIKVIYNADYLETDPLGKAEWLKLFGALYCREAMADSIFSSEAKQYAGIKSFIESNISERPKVLLGLPFKDTWFISPGNSFISKLISDAGGKYIWSDTKSSVSMPYGLENVYLKALEADFWLNISTVHRKDEIPAFDSRLSELPCFKSGNLYNNNKRITLSGGNDFWEGGTVYPHLLLKDIATILHPDLFSETELYFYRRVE